jgi:hypothetical protein
MQNPIMPSSHEPEISRWKSFYAGLPKLLAGSGIALLFIASALLVKEVFRDEQFPASIRWAQLFIIFAAFLFLGATIAQAARREEPGAWRGVGYQVAAFLILGLSLRAFAIHEENRENQAAAVASTQAAAPPKTPHETSAAAKPGANPEPGRPKPSGARSVISVAELASIMILFVLAEFGAFIGRDVGRLQDLTERTLKHADTLQKAFEKAESSIRDAAETLAKYDLPVVIAEIQGDARDELRKLLTAWANRFHDVRPEESGMGPFLSTAWRVLMREYFIEENSNFALSNLNQKRGIPAAARPFRSVDHETGERFVKPSDVSYFATDVGFYARLLAALTTELHEIITANGVHKRYMRIVGVTSVLPEHWWNWPMSDGIWAAYDPVTRLRKVTAAIPDEVQTDRILLVRPDDSAQVPGLSAEAELAEMMRWVLLDRPEGSRYLTYSDLLDGQNAVIVDRLIDPLRRSLDRLKTEPQETHVFPVMKSRIEGELPPMVAGWPQPSLLDAYLALHKGGGDCWVVPAKPELLRNLEGRYDLTFFGTTTEQPASMRKEKDDFAALWKADVDWQFCLMTSVSPASETMFLTVVSGEAARLHFANCSAAFDRVRSMVRLRDFKGPTPTPPKTIP